MFKIAICDDTQECIDLLENLIREESQRTSANVEITTYRSGEEFLCEIEEECKFDMVFLDIELGDISGISIGKEMYAKTYKCIVFFVSHYKDYVYKTFEAHPFSFLSKPVDPQLFQSMFEDACEKINRNKDIFRFFYNRVQFQVFLSDVIYFVSDKRKVNIVCKDNVIYSSYRKLDDIENEIGTSHLFIRIHKSYLVNTDFIRKYAPEYVVLDTGEVFSISEDRRRNISQIYLNNFTKGLN